MFSERISLNCIFQKLDNYIQAERKKIAEHTAAIEKYNATPHPFWSFRPKPYPYTQELEELDALVTLQKKIIAPLTLRKKAKEENLSVTTDEEITGQTRPTVNKKKHYYYAFLTMLNEHQIKLAHHNPLKQPLIAIIEQEKKHLWQRLQSHKRTQLPEETKRLIHNLENLGFVTRKANSCPLNLKQLISAVEDANIPEPLQCLSTFHTRMSSEEAPENLASSSTSNSSSTLDIDPLTSDSRNRSPSCSNKNP